MISENEDSFSTENRQEEIATGHPIGISDIKMSIKEDDR